MPRLATGLAGSDNNPKMWLLHPDRRPGHFEARTLVLVAPN